jgi:hypothetical protein
MTMGIMFFIKSSGDRRPMAINPCPALAVPYAPPRSERSREGGGCVWEICFGKDSLMDTDSSYSFYGILGKQCFRQVSLSFVENDLLAKTTAAATPAKPTTGDQLVHA